MAEEIGLGTVLDMSGMDKGMSQYDRAIDKLNSTTKRAASEIGHQLDVLGATITTSLGATVTAISSAAVGLGTAVARTGLDFNAMKESAQLAFETMLGSGEKAKAFLDDLEQFAARTPFEFNDLTQASQRLLAMGFAASDILPMMQSIGDAVAGLGGGAAEIDRVTRALGQMNAKGKVQSEEMMQLTELGIPAWEILAKTLNTDVADAMDQVTKGAVAASTAVPALIEGMNQRFGGLMAKQAEGWTGLISTIKDTWEIMSGTVMEHAFESIKERLKTIVDFTSSPEFTAGVEMFGEWVGRVVEAVLMLVDRALPPLISGIQSLAAAVKMLYTGDFEGGIFGLHEDSTTIKFLLGMSTAIKGLVDVLILGKEPMGDWSTWMDHMLPTSESFAKIMLGIGEAFHDLRKFVLETIVPFVSWQDVLAAAAIAVGVFVAPLASAVASLTAVAAGTVVAVATIRHAWEKDWGGIREIVQTISTWLQMEFGRIGQAFEYLGRIFNGGEFDIFTRFEDGSSILGTFLEKLGLSEGIAQALGNTFAAVGNAIVSVFERITEAASYLQFIFNGGEFDLFTQFEDGSSILGAFLEKLGLSEERAEAWSSTIIKVGEVVQQAFEVISGAITSLFTNLSSTGGFIGGVFDRVRVIIDAGVELISTILTRGGGSWTSIFSTAWELIKRAVETGLFVVEQAIRATTDIINGDWAGAWEKIVAAAMAVWSLLEEAWNATLAKLITYINDHKAEWMEQLSAWAGAAWKWIVEASKMVGTKLGEWWSTIRRYVDEHKSEWVDRLGEWAGAAWEWIVAAAKVVGTKLGEWWSAIRGYVDEHKGEWGRKLTEWATIAWQWIVDATTQLPTKLGEWWLAAKNYIDEHREEWGTKLGEWATIAWQWIVDAATALPGKIGEWWTALKGWYDGHKQQWANKIAEWTKLAWDWIVDAAAKLPTTFDAWYQKIKQWLDENYPSFKLKMSEWGDALVNWITESEPTAKTYQDNWYLALSRTMGQKLTDFLTGMVQWATAIVSWIGDAIPNMLTAIGDFVDAMVAWMLDPSAGGKSKIAGGLTEWISMFLDWISGPEGLITKLVPEWQKLGTAIWEAIINIFTSFDELKLRLQVAAATVGAAIVTGMIGGVTSGLNDLTTAVGGIAGEALQTLKDALGIQSPSKETEDIAQLTLMGFTQGITNNMRFVLEAATQLVQDFMQKFDIIISDLPKIAQNAMLQFLSLFRAGMEAVQLAAQSGAQTFMHSFDDAPDYLRSVFQAVTDSINSALRDGYSIALDQTHSFVGAMQELIAQMAANLNSQLSRVKSDIQSGLAEAQLLLNQATTQPTSTPSGGASSGGTGVNEVLHGLNEVLGHLANFGEVLEAVEFGYHGEVGAQINSIMQSLLGQSDEVLKYLRYVISSYLGNPNRPIPSASQYPNVSSVVADQVDTLIQSFANSLGIHSPSSKFDWLGEMSARGWTQGWDRVIEAFNRSAAQLVNQAIPSVSVPSATVTPYATSTAVSNQFGPNYINTPLDLAEFRAMMADAVNKSL